MTSRSPKPQSKKILVGIALIATALALYLHVFELRSRQREARLANSRLERAVEQAGVRLKAEILAELRAGGVAADPGTQPLPDRVLRRREPDPEAPGAVGQSLDALVRGGPSTLDGLSRRIAALAQRQEETERALRGDLEDLRAATESAAEVAHQVTTLTLVALIALAGALLAPFRAAAADRQPETPESSGYAYAASGDSPEPTERSRS